MAGSAAVVLAAGGGSRFVGDGGGHKLLAHWQGRPLVTWAIAAAAQAGCAHTWVVTGAVDLHRVVPAGVEILVNDRWAEGQATSLQTAVAAAAGLGLEALVVGLGDQPGIPPQAWRSVASATSAIAVATYDGRRRNPVRLAAEVWPLLPVAGDDGARVLFRRHPELVREVACWGDPGDIDTLEDLKRMDPRPWN